MYEFLLEVDFAFLSTYLLLLRRQGLTEFSTHGSTSCSHTFVLLVLVLLDSLSFHLHGGLLLTSQKGVSSPGKLWSRSQGQGRPRGQTWDGEQTGGKGEAYSGRNWAMVLLVSGSLTEWICGCCQVAKKAVTSEMLR